MIGAIIGDIVGSRFQWENRKDKSFELFHRDCHVTDDSIMTLAVAQALLNTAPDYGNLSDNVIQCMRRMGRAYPNAEYGTRFYHWLFRSNPQPYHSFGNGAAMRISPVGLAAASPEQARELSRAATEVTHNHPEGIKAAEAVTIAIFMARHEASMDEIRKTITSKYYSIHFTLDQIRPRYRFDVTCQGSVPQAFEAFFESTDFEDAIRNAISIGGDSDTIAAICDGIAEAFYGVPEEIRKKALLYMDPEQRDILEKFEKQFS